MPWMPLTTLNLRGATLPLYTQRRTAKSPSKCDVTTRLPAAMTAAEEGAETDSVMTHVTEGTAAGAEMAPEMAIEAATIMLRETATARGMAAEEEGAVAAAVASEVPAEATETEAGPVLTPVITTGTSLSSSLACCCFPVEMKRRQKAESR